ncbi:MAG: tyrosine-protein phosphatase [Elusimicrobia bacterium]|nr:tyrosine-protein phosphatase [Elusimicrobiota bacterium]
MKTILTVLLFAPCVVRAGPAEVASSAAEARFAESVLHPGVFPPTKEREPRWRDAGITRRSAGSVPANLGELPGKVFRGAALTNREQYAHLKRVLGVDVAVNLRERSEDLEACGVYGLECRHFPIRLFWPVVRNVNWDTMKEAFKFVLEKQAQGKTVYFHCTHGADRTGAMAAALTVRREACGKAFSPDALWSQVKADLDRHQFNESWFPDLGRDIKDLVYKFSEHRSWLCR